MVWKMYFVSNMAILSVSMFNFRGIFGFTFFQQSRPGIDLRRPYISRVQNANIFETYLEASGESTLFLTDV